MDFSSQSQIHRIVFVLVALGSLTSCQSVPQERPQRTGGCVREVASNAVLVAEYKTGPGDLIDVREYRLDGQMPVIVLVDKNHDGRPDLLLKQDASTGMIEMMISDTDFDGHFDTFAVPAVLTLKDVNGDGWPDEYWKGYHRPTTVGNGVRK